MWESDEAVEALKDLLNDSHESLSKLLEALYETYRKNPTPNMHMMFLAGKFSHLFQHRLKMVRGEETRESLHIVLNEILKDERVKILMKQMVGDVSDKVAGVKQ
jgi:lipopolysaccharide biosynthesis regulator YciM|tara:strand:- start:966 stop:1277 length:312 start_codon:yes stop_codon:yes gene_type:complete